MIGRVLRSLAGLVGVVAALVGIPMALWLLGGNPLPGNISVEALRTALLTPDDGQLLIRIVTWVGWVAWLVFAVSLVVELVAQISGRNIRLPGLRVPQLAAAPLVAMLLAVFIAAPIVVGAAAGVAHADPGDSSGPPPPPPSVGQQHTGSDRPAAEAPTSSPQKAVEKDRAAPDERKTEKVVTHTVERGETLWGLAKHYYGDGMKWKKLASANADLVGESGSNYLEVGWTLTVPNAATQKAAHASDDQRPGTTYTVERGDTLSAIADDAYGSPQKWPTIAKANPDVIDDPNLIDIGDRLDLPTTTKPAADSDHRTSTTTRDTGSEDTGSSESGRSSHHSTHDDRSAQAGSDRDTAEQSTGRPDATHSERAGENTAPGQRDTGSTPTRGTVPSAAPTPETGQSSRTEAPAAPVEAAPSPEAFSDTRLWAGAASALLAAGVVGLLAQRRRAMSITRRPGRRLAAMSDDAEQAVTALRQAEQPLTVAHLDRALRTLSAGVAAHDDELPLITAVRLDDDRLDLRLLQPHMNPPKPFTTVDGTVWTLTSDRSELLLDAALANQVPAPYPALVTLGQDDDGAHILVDLETIAALTLTTPSPDEASGLLAALAFELATSTWADDLTITLVGVCPELPAALGVDRARHLDHIDELIDQLEADADESTNLLVDEGLADTHQGRRHDDGADSWTPHIVLVGHELTAAMHERLGELLARAPRVAIAAVTTGTRGLTEWALTVTDAGADLEPLGLHLTPQRLAGSSYDAVCAALRQSQHSDTEPAPWWNHADDAHAPDDDTLTDDATTAAALPAADPGQPPSADPEPLPAAAQPLVVVATPGQLEADQAAPTIAATAGETDVAGTGSTASLPAAQDLTDTEATDTDATETEPGVAEAGEVQDHQLRLLHRPTLLLLGPVEIVNAGGTTAAARTANEVLEPIAYVYLNPDSLTTKFKEAMAGRTSKPDELASRARRFLGTAPDGSKLFPSARRDGTARRYQLHPHVYSDWTHFQSLIAGGVNTTSTAHLEAALRLVRGRPLATIPAGMWRWAHDWREEAIATIVDTAHDLAVRRMSQGDIDGARWAVRQGRSVDELTEILARDEIRLERMAGNHSRVQRLAEQIVQVAHENRVQPDPETIELLHEVRDGRRRRTAQ